MSKYALQKVEIRNNISLEEAEKQYKNIVKKKPRKVRESKNFYQFRHLPPTKFEKKSFRTKVVNKDIRLIYGELKPEHHHLEGGGLFDYFKKGYDYAKNAVVSAFTINDYSDKTKKNLKLYGDVPVIHVEIRRKPLKAIFELGFSAFSAGQWDKLKDKYGFDKFFHLSMIVTLQKEKGGAKREMSVEKLEVVSFNDDIHYKAGDGTEVQSVNVTTPFTVREMFDRTRARVGDKTFFSYSGVGGNNCQDFIAMCLTSVGLYGAPEKLFTYQDMASLTSELHTGTKFVARSITQLGALANKYLGIGGNHEGMEEMEGGTHRENVLKLYKLKDKGYSLKELSKISAVPEKTLQEVYNRGIGAYGTQNKSVRLKNSYMKNVDAPASKKLSKEQWAMARVYSFLDGNPKHDEDLRMKEEGKDEPDEVGEFYNYVIAHKHDLDVHSLKQMYKDYKTGLFFSF